MQSYSVALTSCGRFDLLERTLRSLLPRLDGPLERIFIAEDSGDRQVLDVAERLGGIAGTIEVLVNDPPLGHIGSVDRLYSRIETEWVFHCEDDWEFSGEGLIERSFAVLRESDRYSMVSLRRVSEHGIAVFGPEEVTASGVGYHVAHGEIPWNGEAAGLNFNPGLRRMRDYRTVGPYAALGRHSSEAHVSRAYRDLGLRVTCLAEPAVRHIGEGRRVRDPFQRRGLAHRMARSVRKRWLRLQGRLPGGRIGQ